MWINSHVLLTKNIIYYCIRQIYVSNLLSWKASTSFKGMECHFWCVPWYRIHHTPVWWHSLMCHFYLTLYRHFNCIWDIYEIIWSLSYFWYGRVYLPRSWLIRDSPSLFGNLIKIKWDEAWINNLRHRWVIAFHFLIWKHLLIHPLIAMLFSHSLSIIPRFLGLLVS